MFLGYLAPHFYFSGWTVGIHGWSCWGAGCTPFVGRESFGWEAPPTEILCGCVSASSSMVCSGEKSLPCFTLSLSLLSFEIWDVCVLGFRLICIFFYSVSYCTQNIASNGECFSLTYISLLIWEWVGSWPLQVSSLRKKVSVLFSASVISVHSGYNQLSLPLL